MREKLGGKDEEKCTCNKCIVRNTVIFLALMNRNVVFPVSVLRLCSGLTGLRILSPDPLLQGI